MQLIMNIVGDVSLGPYPLSYNSGIDLFIKKNGARETFKYVAEELKSADINFLNLESPLLYKSIFNDVRKYFLRGLPEYAIHLYNAGFNVINTVNNHSFDHGARAYEECKNVLTNYGFLTLEYVDQNYQKPLLKIINKLSHKIGFFSFCLNIGSLKPPVTPPSISEMTKYIRKAREIVDFLIVSLHWGYEYTYFPSKEQIIIAHKIVDAGADLIIGHHPHVLQPVELYKDKLILYSTGNFIFDFNASNSSCIYKIYIDIDNGILRKVRCVPIIIEKYGIPRILGMEKEIEILDSDALLSSIPKNYINYYEEMLRHAKVKMLTHLIKNSIRYNKEWYKWYIMKKLNQIKKIR